MKPGLTRYIVTDRKARHVPGEAYNPGRLHYLGSGSSLAEANRIATRWRQAGERALVHDLLNGRIVRDTGKCLGQVWGLPSRKGEASPAYFKTEYADLISALKAVARG